MNTKKIGDFIKRKRKEKGITQKELAEMLSITDRAISKWERGLSCPDISLLQELSKILGVSVVELLKGEEVEDRDCISEQDVVSSMKLSRDTALEKIKLCTNFLTIIIVGIFVIFVFVTSWNSIYLELKKYDMNFHNYGGIGYPGEDYINKDPYYDTEIYKTYIAKTEIIMANQGKYEDLEYQKIKNYTKIMRERIAEQNNEKYYQITDYTYLDFLNFYVQHQNLQTIEINTEDLYDILKEYDDTMIDHYYKYKELKEMVLWEWTEVRSFLSKPHYFGTYNVYDYPNVYGIMNSIYEKEIMLCDDIIKVGELNEL